MSTPNRIEINRANAQHSTGPITEAGKKRSSLNALRHGLTGQVIVMPSEDLEAYNRHLQSFTDEYQPQGATEAHLVQSMADAAWRLNRVAALETNLLTLAIGDQPGEPAQDALAIAGALATHTKALANLSLHGQRLFRQFERTIVQLRELQKIRQTNEKHELDNLLDIIHMYKSQGQTYDPAADGFVFSPTQIQAAIHARNRENRHTDARRYRPAQAAA